MLLSSKFDYDLPERLIAQTPVERRDTSRMMCIDRKTGRIYHCLVNELPDILDGGDLLVKNDTKVVPARIEGVKPTGGKVELLFVEELRTNVWEVLMRASRKPKPGTSVVIGNGVAEAEVLEHGERGRATIRVKSEKDLGEILNTMGSTPLPPYIKRASADSSQNMDSERYQTVYAREPGAVAAPTAGLHFTPKLFSELEERGVDNVSITLHVGPGTFRPVSSEYLEDHVMDEERYEISPEAADRIAHCKGRCVAIGSTSVRTLETVALEKGRIEACKGRSDLYIYPPFEFKAVDAMLTNFHLPRSTLLMMVCAFGGYELVMEAYQRAIEEQYRFYSYGDCMLIL